MNSKSFLAIVLGLGLWAGTIRAQGQTAPYLLLSSTRPLPAPAAAPDNPNSSCGKVALAELAQLLKGEPFDVAPILQTPAPPEGFSLAELARLGEANQLGLAAVKWNREGELPVPSLIHLSRGHYAVLAAQHGGRYRMLDPLWGPRWFTLDQIKTQASGNLLIPEAWLKNHVSSYTSLYRSPSHWHKLLTQSGQ
jgi:ABC-type bacteriocin/lantibiotic exporter with double-glycine peptidase domain